MKRFVLSAIMLLGAFLFQSCNGGYIIDYAPIEITLSVQDNEGKDLLNPATEGTLATEGTRLLYDGVYYDLNIEQSIAMNTRYYMPEFYGIKLAKDSSGYILEIGEFDGARNTEWTEMTIEWSDGTTDTFAYSRKIGGIGRHPRVKTKYYHNGDEMDSSHMRLVK